MEGDKAVVNLPPKGTIPHIAGTLDRPRHRVEEHHRAVRAAPDARFPRLTIKGQGLPGPFGKSQVTRLEASDFPGSGAAHRFHRSPFRGGRPHRGFRDLLLEEVAEEVREIPPGAGEAEQEMEHHGADSNEFVQSRKKESGTAPPSQP